MVYSLTDKLKFAENPQIEVKGKLLTINADAETVLKLFDLHEKEGDFMATLKAVEFLFSEKDRKTIKNLKLSMEDYTTLVSTAMSLAMGEDPDADEDSE